MDLKPLTVKAPGEEVGVVDARIRVRPVETSWNPSRLYLPSDL